MLVNIFTSGVLSGFMVFWVAGGIPSVASAGTRPIRVVAYNIEDDISGYTTPRPGLIAPSGGSVTNSSVLEGIGEENEAGDPAQPIDILGLEETTSTEPMYETLVAAGTNQAFDPLNPSGLTNVTWGSSALTALTESATSVSARFDYELMTNNVLYGVAGGGLAYVPGTYHPFGNNGSTRNVGSGDTALNNDLMTNVTGTTASDHRPIVADCTKPAPTVFLIVIENENGASISGNAVAPYINNSLPSMASHAELYFTVTQVMTH